MVYSIIAFVLIIMVFYGIGIYNKLVKLKNLVQEAWSGIDVQLKKRYNLIPNLVETVKGYARHESETFEKITQARTHAQSAHSVKDQQNAENQLGKAVMNLFAVAEQYPDLKANSNFLNLQEKLSIIEQDIERSRRYYNGTVRDQNTLIESFPSNLFANAFGFGKSEFFELENQEQRTLPNVSF